MSSILKAVNPEIKKQILERVKEGKSSIPDLAKDHGISSRTIYKWISKGVEAPPSILELAKLKKENQRLKELIGAVTYELTLEKKKMAGV